MKTNANHAGRFWRNFAYAALHTVSMIALLAGGSAAATTLHVWHDNPNPAPPYDSWGNAATNIQDAVDAAQADDLVLVTNGVYATGGRAVVGTMTNRVVIDKAITVQSVNGPEVTVIRGAPAPGGVNGNGDGAMRCVNLGTNALLSGFTLTNGCTRTTGDYPYEVSGGGVLCDDSATLTNCIITGNSAAYGGGGAYGGTLYNCTLTENSASAGGGARDSTLNNCTLLVNSAHYGGGTYDSVLHNCALSSNSAVYDGGGAYSGYDTWSHTWNSALSNCTLTGNSAGRSGGGAAGGAFYNCIVCFNVAGSDSNYAGQWVWPFSGNGGGDWAVFVPATFNYSCTTPLPSNGTNNIPADPRLATLTHLSTSSPCIGAGSSAYATGVDIDGEPWASPPCIGADQVTPGQATGALRMSIEADYTNVATAFGVGFVAQNAGAILMSSWDFGDGTDITNQALAAHAWSAPGTYTVRLTGYNQSFPDGVTATVQVEVSDTVHYVNQANSTPLFPYTSWATAATNIQDAIETGTTAGRLVLVTNGVYASGSVAAEGNNRIALTSAVQVRSVNGAEVTVIEGAAGERCAYLGMNASLTGFTLTKGEANVGGGAWCEAFAALTNCVVRDNTAGDGGGTSGGTLYNCTLTGNSAWDGGGVYGGTLYYCTLKGNAAEPDDGLGGGCFGCTLYNCTLRGNSAYDGGGTAGGMLYHCSLTDNSADDGGGGSYFGALDNCTLSDNSASSWGGGVMDCTLNNCNLSSNSAWDGGGVYGGTLYNCTLTSNSARRDGGGAEYCTLYNCTVIGNWAFDSGGGVYWSAIYNCVIYFNSAPFSPNYGIPDYLPINYSCTTPLPTNGQGNILADPRLATLTHLSASSPCIGAGSRAYASGLDIDGEPWGNPPCMGADQLTLGQATGELAMAIEAQYTNVTTGFAVRLLADNRGPVLTSTWDFGDRTFLTNQPIASHAWRAPGLYTVRLTGYNDSFDSGVSTSLVVQVVQQPIYYVNQANTTPRFPYTSWETASTNIQSAIEAGTTAGRLVLVTNGVFASGTVEAEGSNRIALTGAVVVRSVNGPEVTVIKGAAGIRCAYLGMNASLGGFTLTRGGAHNGGGAWCEDSGTLTNCIVMGNSAMAGGGAYGGRLYNCALTHNSTTGSDPYGVGGGAHGCTLYNCTVVANSASSFGGGASLGTLYNCTLTGNSASRRGGGVFRGTLDNCIVYFNSASGGADYYYNSTFNHSCTTPLPADGVGNIDLDPLFVDAGGWSNLRLRSNSPCINAGNNAYAQASTDLDGRPRINGGIVDLGAYESQPGVSGAFIGWLQLHGLPTDSSADTADLDGDLMNSWQEWLADTDPTDALSFFHIENISKQSPATISFLSSSNRTYTLWGTPQLAPPDWTLVPGQQAIPGTGGTLTLSDPTAAPEQLYRVEVNLP